MHSFIKTIGFQDLKNKREMDQVIQKIIAEPDRKDIVFIPSADTRFVQLWKEFGSGIGISVVGEMDSSDQISVEYYFPYVEGSQVQEQMTLQIERFADREAYAGLSEDASIGITLIFYMQNVGEFLKNEYSEEYFLIGDKVQLAALASKGTILLSLSQDKKKSKKEEALNKKRKKLMEAAKAGNLQAIESLTLDDMDLYTLIARRSKREDVFSIVDTCFMPYGMESDQYSIIGTIKAVEKTKNCITNEEIYLLLVECNNLSIKVAIAKKDLLGEPMKGRRLKANIWLQGNVELLKWEED